MTATTSPSSGRAEFGRTTRRAEFVFVLPLGFVVLATPITILLPASIRVIALALATWLLAVP